MKARLTDGQVVDLVKDCECRTHEGPHWLHMDALDRERNRALSPRGFIKEEQARLREKAWNMEHRGIVEILKEEKA